LKNSIQITGFAIKTTFPDFIELNTKQDRQHIVQKSRRQF